jgi:hypothetical protein
MSSARADPAHDIRVRTLLSSWKLSRGFRLVASEHYRNRIVPRASQSDLNRDFATRRESSAGWFILALLVLAPVDYLCLRIGL